MSLYQSSCRLGKDSRILGRTKIGIFSLEILKKVSQLHSRIIFLPIDTLLSTPSEISFSQEYDCDLSCGWGGEKA